MSAQPNETARDVLVTQADLDAADALALDTGIAPKEERLRHALAAIIASNRIAATRKPDPSALVEALEQARRDIVNLAVSGTDRINDLCRKLQKTDPSPIWPIPFPDPPERTWQPIVRQIDTALAAWEASQ